jgi:hypothetical protein
MQTMRGVLDPQRNNIDALSLQGPHMSVNQGLIVNDEVILHMYQNVLTKKMTVDESIADATAQVRKLTQTDS